MDEMVSFNSNLMCIAVLQILSTNIISCFTVCYRRQQKQVQYLV